MKLNKLIRIGDAIELLSNETDTDIPEIVEALTGVCFDEEDAGEIRQYHQNDPD